MDRSTKKYVTQINKNNKNILKFEHSMQRRA